MSSLATHDEYKAIAETLVFPCTAFVNGKFQAAKNGATFPTLNPATGEVLANISDCGQDDLDYAVEKSREAFEAGVWSNMHLADRKQVLIQLVMT